MRGRPMTLVVMLLLSGLVGLTVPTAAAAQQGSRQAERQVERHCTAEIDKQGSEPKNVRCFSTFAEAITAATKGRVRLEPSVQPGDLTDAMLVQNESLTGDVTAQSDAVIGIDYQDSGFRGNTYTWTGSDANGCRNGSTYAVPSMPNNWDNKVSSARGFTGCQSFIHYQDQNYGGASINCACSSMGIMNDRTSSEQWRP